MGAPTLKVGFGETGSQAGFRRTGRACWLETEEAAGGGSVYGRPQLPPWDLELLVAGMPEARRSSGEEWWSTVWMVVSDRMRWLAGMLGCWDAGLLGCWNATQRKAE